jgi:hypothetical protein
MDTLSIVSSLLAAQAGNTQTQVAAALLNSNARTENPRF